MRVSVITPPAPVLTFEEVGQHLRLGDDIEEQDYLASLIAAATAHIDGPDGWLGRAIGLQTLEMRASDFGCGPILLPYPPFVDMVSVTIAGPDAYTSVDPETYVCEEGWLAPRAGGWPALPEVWGLPRVRIRYRAGYVAIPAPIKHALLLMIGDMYAFRETAAISASPTSIAMSTTVEALLSPYRVWL